MLNIYQVEKQIKLKEQRLQVQNAEMSALRMSSSGRNTKVKKFNKRIIKFIQAVSLYLSVYNSACQ